MTKSRRSWLMLAAGALAIAAGAVEARTAAGEPLDGKATRGQLRRLLRRAKAGEDVQQRVREQAFRARLALLRGADLVPSPPLTGEWQEEGKPLRLRERGIGTLAVSRPGSWEPDKTYRMVTTTTTVTLAGENPCLIEGRLRSLKESGTLELSPDGNWLRGTLTRVDEFGLAGGGPLGKIDERKVAWRRKHDLALVTMMAWREAILTAPHRVAAEKKALAELEKQRKLEEDRLRRLEEEKRRKEEEERRAEAELLGEGDAGNMGMPEMPPLLPPPSLDGTTPASAAADAGGPPPGGTPPETAGAGDVEAAKLYLVGAVPKMLAQIGEIDKIRQKLPGMILNPAGAAQVVRGELAPALKKFRDAVESTPPPAGPLGELHQKLLEAASLQDQAVAALEGGGGMPNPQILQQMQSLGKEAASRVKEYKDGLSEIAKAAGVEVDALKGP